MPQTILLSQTNSNSSIHGADNGHLPQTNDAKVYSHELPLVVQGDRTLLLDVHTALSKECATALIPFAELVRSPEHLHTYRLTPLSLWNAATSGFSAGDAIAVLVRYSRYEVPQQVVQWIEAMHSRFGRIVMDEGEGIGEDGLIRLSLTCDTPLLAREVGGIKALEKYLCVTSDRAFSLETSSRGTVKQILTNMGLPVKDVAPLMKGEALDVSLREVASSGVPFAPRDYQVEAADKIVGDGKAGTGFGTVVLPCGAGKTLVGMLVMTRLKTHTLILTTNISAAKQWIAELLDKTTLRLDEVAEYTGETKAIAPVTVATYQVLTWRPHKEGPYPHFALFREHPWGLVIYDEVHTLPAPVFRVAAEVQSMHRLGLTATLVREDGHETDVFSLVGPKRYDVPWKELEKARWIATAQVVEVRIGMSYEIEEQYAASTQRGKFRAAAENPAKLDVVQAIADASPEDKILVIGQYLSSLKEIAARLRAPIITGQTSTKEREEIYSAFRSGKIRLLVVSKVANFAIDLPDASMAIQISGTFGSRQEEAQRLGRILRPKERTSRFFTLITRDTVEEDFGSNRQKFLAEQGYSYRIVRYDGIDDLPSVLSPQTCGSSLANGANSVTNGGVHNTLQLPHTSGSSLANSAALDCLPTP